MLRIVRSSLVLVALALATPSVAAAQTESQKQARQLYGEGVELFKAGEFGDAAKKFQQAYDIDPSPILLYNLARAAEEMGQAKAAVGHYKAYIARFPEAEDKAEVERRIRTLEAVLTAAMNGFLSIGGLPDGAEVQIDGERVPPGPDGRWKLKPGEYEVVVDATGTERWSAKAAIRDADTTRLDYVGATAGPDPTGGPGGMVIGGWTAIGVGVLALGAGTFFYAQTFSDADEFDQASGDLAKAYAVSGREDDPLVEDAAARKEQARDDHSSNGTLAYVMWGVGVAAAATGATLLVLDDGDQQAAIVPTLGGLGVVGRF